jgi:predicted phosphohydrolase
MMADAATFQSWLADEQPQVHFLQDEGVTIDGVQFFGGTMWTDFAGASASAMTTAQHLMNDFRYIMSPVGRPLLPAETIRLHAAFVNKLLDWFVQDLPGPRVVITHHAPVVNPATQHRDSPLAPAFNSLDMVEVIEKYQPQLWIYGHTHECDDQMIGCTRIISNQAGYPKHGLVECAGFDTAGLMVEI